MFGGPRNLEPFGSGLDVGHFDLRVDGEGVELSLVSARVLAVGAGAVVAEPEGGETHGRSVKVDQNLLIRHVVDEHLWYARSAGHVALSSL